MTVRASVSNNLTTKASVAFFVLHISPFLVCSSQKVAPLKFNLAPKPNRLHVIYVRVVGCG